MYLDREQVAGPPKGFRPAIPWKAKMEVVLRQDGKCKRCGVRLGQLADSQFDHNPPLQGRIWCAETRDTVPSANDPEFLDALHVDCHKAKTTGRKGTSKLSVRGGDVQEIAKTRSLERQQERFRRQLCTKADDGPEERSPKQKPKTKWPKRPFPRRPKHGPADTRSEDRTAGSGDE